MNELFQNRYILGLKKVLLYSIYSVLFSILLLLIDFISGNAYFYNIDVTMISIIKFIVITIFLFYYYTFLNLKFRINFLLLIIFSLVIDIFIFFILDLFNKNVFLYLKISCLFSIIPVYFTCKNNILQNVQHHIKSVITEPTYNYIKYGFYFLFYTNPLFFLGIILMFISYDFLFEEVFIILILSIMMYSLIKIFIGFFIAYKIKNQQFYIEKISKNMVKIFITLIVLDIFNVFLYYLLNKQISFNEMIFYILNLSLSFAFLPFFIIHVKNKRG